MRAKTLFFLFVPVVLILTAFNAGWRLTLIYIFIISVGGIISAAKGLGDGATKFFPLAVIFYAPLWIAERSLSTYWAFYWYFTRGGYPFGDKVVSKGTGRAWNTESPSDKADL